MAFINEAGRTVFRDDVTFFARATRGTNESSSAFDLGDKAAVFVKVTVSGTPGGTNPALTVIIEGSDNASSWFELGRIGSDGYRVGSLGTAPAAITAAGTYRGCFPTPRYVRCTLSFGGTSPSFDVSVAGDAA